MEYLDTNKQAFEQLNNGTFAELAHTIYHPDIVYFYEGAGQELQGIDAFVANSVDFQRALPDMHVTLLDDYEIDGNIVTVRTRATGTFTGDMTGPDGGLIPGNGSYAEWDAEFELTFTDGKISRWVSRIDTQDFMRQLGLG